MPAIVQGIDQQKTTQNRDFREVDETFCHEIRTNRLVPGFRLGHVSKVFAL